MFASIHYEDGTIREIDLNTNPRLRGTKWNNQRPIKVVLPEFCRNTIIHLRCANYCIHPYLGVVEFDNMRDIIMLMEGEGIPKWEEYQKVT